MPRYDRLRAWVGFQGPKVLAGGNVPAWLPASAGEGSTSSYVQKYDTWRTRRIRRANMPVLKSERIETFNTVVGAIFSQLYQAFPFPISINLEEIADLLDVEKEVIQYFSLPLARDVPTSNPQLTLNSKSPNGDRFGEFCERTLQWLRDEGFIRTNDHHVFHQVVLSNKAMTLLSVIPEGLKDHGNETVGSKLMKATHDLGIATADDVRRQSAHEVVGLVAHAIGSMVRGLHL